MICNKIIHQELHKMGDYYCGFCNTILVYNNDKKVEDKCCENMDLLTDNYMKICVNCGQIVSFELIPP